MTGDLYLDFAGADITAEVLGQRDWVTIRITDDNRVRLNVLMTPDQLHQLVVAIAEFGDPR